MNDRIKQLAEQAGFIASAPTLSPTLEKFAELIVRECIDIAYSEGDNVAYLALHFGAHHD